MVRIIISGILLGIFFEASSQEVKPVAVLSKHAGAVASLAWSPDGALLVSGSEDKTAVIWKKDSWEPAAVLSGAHVRSIMSLVFSSDGQKIYTGGDRSIVSWNTDGTKDKTIGTTVVDIWSLSLAPGGKYLAAGTFEKKVHIYDLVTGAHVRTLDGHEKSVLAVAWLDENRLVSGSLDETVRIWDVPTGRILQTLTGHGGNIYSIAVHPATGLFVTASRDNSVRLWQAGKGKSIRTFIGHDQAVMSVSLSPDARWMLTGSYDNTVILWETATANKIYTFTGFEKGVNSVAFNPGAGLFAVGSGDGKVRVFEVSKNLFVDYYFGSEVEKELSAMPEFAPRGKEESKQDYKNRQAKAEEAKKQVYDRYYLKYLEILKQQDPAREK
mgnify:CR=1 FL=1